MNVTSPVKDFVRMVRKQAGIRTKKSNPLYPDLDI